MSPHEKYKASVMSTATKEEKLMIIFNETIKILNKAIKCIEINDFEGKNTNLQAAAEALSNLRIGIDAEKGGDFAKNLDEFCLRISNKIGFINMGNGEVGEVNNVINGIVQIRNLFKEEKPSTE